MNEWFGTIKLYINTNYNYFILFSREHPEEHREKEEFEEYFETDNQRELRQIFAGQSQMFDALRELNRKLDEILGRQERSLSLISQIQVGGEISFSIWTHTPEKQIFYRLYLWLGVATGGQPGQVQLIDTIRRQEVDSMLSNQNNLMNTAKEMQSMINDLYSKTDLVLNNQARAPTAQVFINT